MHEAAALGTYQMAIRTTVAPHYAWKMIVIAIVSLVLGVWGVYDYVWKIPTRELAHERGAVSAAVRNGLQPGAPLEDVALAKSAVQSQKDELGAALSSVEPPVDEPAAEALAENLAAHISSLDEAHDQYWHRAVVTYDQALELGPLPGGTTLSGDRLHAFDIAESAVQAVATIPRPAAHDRPMQWLFMLCLPAFPWLLWAVYATSRRVYRLDDDGTLHVPEGTWSQEEIADIDMGRWMRKSIAWVVHTDGRRVKLDDYKHRNLHLIIGAIASRLHPEQWDVEAKPIRKASEEESADSGDASVEDAGSMEEPAGEAEGAGKASEDESALEAADRRGS